MLHRLPLKKQHLLIPAVIAITLICYQLAIKPTLAAWQQNMELKRQIKQSSDLAFQPQYQHRKNTNLDKIVELYKADTVVFRNNIISIISDIAEKENVKLTEVPVHDPLYHTTQFIIERLNFEGDYFSLIKVLNRLQHTKQIGVIRGARCKLTGSDRDANDSKKLMLEVYLEIIR